VNPAVRNRALIYIRKPVVRTGADIVSPERQRARCLEEADLPTRRHLLDALVEGLEVGPDARVATVHMRPLLVAGPLEEPLVAWYVQGAPTGVDGSRTHQGHLCGTPQRF
jgi:hypothetical protein